MTDTRQPTNDELMVFQCPGCNIALQTKIQFAGRNVKCPKCNHPFTLPKKNPNMVQSSDLNSQQPTR